MEKVWRNTLIGILLVLIVLTGIFLIFNYEKAYTAVQGQVVNDNSLTQLTGLTGNVVNVGKTQNLSESDWVKNGGTFMNNGVFPHWKEMPVTYSISKECGNYESARIRKAMLIIQNDTGDVVRFTEVNGTGDISIFCNNQFKAGDTKGTFESGNAQPEFTGEEIKSAIINFNKVDEISGYYPGGCVDYPAVEIHEILHTFGFGHTTKSLSIMNPIGNGCRAKMDKEILDALKEIYG